MRQQGRHEFVATLYQNHKAHLVASFDLKPTLKRCHREWSSYR